ncbi:BPL-N domain-containing protein [Gimesia sp.]|uniref:BPL-N domain-containing protein n=1 Tax=Gimesia sp. TaxID=2024833 RepID=UPI003A94CD37
MTRSILTGVMCCLSIFLLTESANASPVEYLQKTSDQPGPVVAVMGVSADVGDAGVRAAQQVAHWKITRGSLVVILDVNARPGLLQQKQDRLGQQSQWGESVEQVLQQVKPDWVVELTESFDAHSLIPEAEGSRVLGAGDTKRMPPLLVSMAAAAQTAATDEEPHWESLLVAKQAADEPSRLVVVTSAKDPGERRVWYRTRQQRAAVHALLTELQMRPVASSLDEMMPAEREAGRIRVAIYQGPGAVSSSGHDPVWIQRTLEALPDFQTALIGPTEIQAGALSRYDVLLVGGGLSNRQSRGLGQNGRAAIVRFVESGGGYVGICAGMFLASSDSDSKLHLLPIDVAGSSGVGKVKLDFQAHDEIRVKGLYPAKFSGGPVKVRKQKEADENIKILAWFRSEPKEKKTSSTLTDTPAIVSGRHGQGRVFLFSPHCERYPGPRSAFQNALRWAVWDEISSD